MHAAVGQHGHGPVRRAVAATRPRPPRHRDARPSPGPSDRGWPRCALSAGPADARRCGCTSSELSLDRGLNRPTLSRLGRPSEERSI
ncbi:hypothetical protein J2W31_002342 [Variovorax boronicumulans]|uniref:Uncharacterized protein n=1 Tax=Variovorax boronicumulans TaxID=436515 RepID=A0AAW8D028_9BURK|nr:hypothetical protein [Variovorax boronicumulans]